jgi:hypothetical protein
MITVPRCLEEPGQTPLIRRLLAHKLPSLMGMTPAAHTPRISTERLSQRFDHVQPSLRLKSSATRKRLAFHFGSANKFSGQVSHRERFSGL